MQKIAFQQFTSCKVQTNSGKEIFNFGWIPFDSNGKVAGLGCGFSALSTGEQLLLLIALMTTIIERINPPLKILIIDNAENLDKKNLKRVLRGLKIAGENLDNILFLGVMEIDSADFPDWRVWNLSGGKSD
ncbi:hypothetical protein FACS1894105_08740 [Clostridia bacterium]|nr:hypothetical protein FACS1894105_08740 [Clostridia bacterium]